jgi:hypothetical protein
MPIRAVCGVFNGIYSTSFSMNDNSLLCKRRIKRRLIRREIQFADERAAFRRAVDAVQAAVFPFHRERAAIADVVQRDDDLFKIDIAATERTEIPEAARVREIRVAAEHADRAVAVTPPDVFHVRVKNAVAEFADEFHIAHALITEVRRIVIETETRMIFDRRQRAFGCGDIERDFRRMYFECEVDVFFFKHIENWQPAFGEIGVAFVEKFLICWRKRVKCVPDGRAGETIHNRDCAFFRARFCVEKFSRGAGGGFHFFGGALANAFRFAIAPDVGGQNRFVPFIDQIADRLADEMIGNGETIKPVFGEQRPFLFAVIRFGERAINFKMVAPAGEFHAVVAHFFDER